MSAPTAEHPVPRIEETLGQHPAGDPRGGWTSENLAEEYQAVRDLTENLARR